MTELQGTGVRGQGSEGGAADDLFAGAEPTHSLFGERVRELEAENARLKSLVGELLVANQRLREAKI